MVSSGPPPVPASEPAWVTYFKATSLILPALLVGFFAKAFIVPKLEQIWSMTKLEGSRMQFLLDASQSFVTGVTCLIPLLILIFTAVEIFVPSWPRRRRLFLGILSQLVYWAVLIGITTVATAAVLAAPLLTRSR
jgi:type II secretory pathway component PulF